MFIAVLFIANILCVSKVCPHTSEGNNSTVKRDGDNLYIVLGNGNRYVINNADVKEYSNANNKQNLTLNDGTTIEVERDTLHMNFENKEKIELQGVQSVDKNGKDLVFNMQNGDQIHVKDAESYKDLGNGKYALNVKEGTSIENQQTEKQKSKSERSRKKSKKSSKLENSAFYSNPINALAFALLLM